MVPQLPAAFCHQMQELLGTDDAAKLFSALEREGPVSVRLNTAKAVGDELATEGEVPWCQAGRYLSARPSFTLDPLFHAGTYYVQEASSMFVEQAFRVICGTFSPLRLLDLCAAPGGKSTLWRSLLPDDTLFVANEPVRSRAEILSENLAKWGNPDVVVTNAYPADFAPLGSFFDVIAADVPCSGEGMFRRDPSAREEWDAEAPVRCAARQWGIIEEVWPALREGGFLVYSTCTFNRQEDEDLVFRIAHELGAELIEIPTLQAWGISGDTTGRNLPAYHFFPHRTRGEGFFLCLLRKTSSGGNGGKAPKARRQKAETVPNAKLLSSWLLNAENYKLFRSAETQISAFRASLFEDAQRVASAARTLRLGLPLAEEKGKKLIPAPHLALSTVLSPEAFPHAELDLPTALSYLRHEAIALPADAPRGYVVVCYQGHPLGFANNLGARANNLYPAEWRIRKL